MKDAVAPKNPLQEVYSDESLEEYPEVVLRESATVAALAMEGFIPKENLPGLVNVIGQEKANLVMEAMNGGKQ